MHLRLARDPSRCDRGCSEMSIELDADKAKLLLDDLTLDRIINAVGETPTKPDRDMLRRDLLDCYAQYCRASAGRPGIIKRQIDRLNSIQKHARWLVELLKADDADLKIIRGEWPLNPDHPAHLLPQVTFLLELIDKMRGAKEKPGDIAESIQARLGMSGSPLQWLINVLLRGVYEKHFGAKAGISRNADGTPSGPYFHFVRQVLVALKSKCADETIASYLEKPEK
jgi:hypothetical protein